MGLIKGGKGSFKMAKLPEETVREIYSAGYDHGRADACREMLDTIQFLTRVACNVLESEIKELTEKKH